MCAFVANYAPLSVSNPEWGTIACLPWDEEIFGFRVAELRPAHATANLRNAEELRNALASFCSEQQVELVSVRFGALELSKGYFYSKVGFVPVDLALEANTRIRPELLMKPRFGIRRATSADAPLIMRMAETAFTFGRYHTDPVFPRELADKRYLVWVRNALNTSSTEDNMFVLGGELQVLGFFHVVVKEDLADLRLAATDPASKVPIGGALYAETFRALADMGVKRVTAKISAANTAVVNLYASLGLRFSQPEQVMHWHAPSARHLVRPE